MVSMVGSQDDDDKSVAHDGKHRREDVHEDHRLVDMLNTVFKFNLKILKNVGYVCGFHDDDSQVCGSGIVMAVSQ